MLTETTTIETVVAPVASVVAPIAPVQTAPIIPVVDDELDGLVPYVKSTSLTSLLQRCSCAKTFAETLTTKTVEVGKLTDHLIAEYRKLGMGAQGAKQMAGSTIFKGGLDLQVYVKEGVQKVIVADIFTSFKRVKDDLAKKAK